MEEIKPSGPNGGKVLRLHFACEAKLPIGSSLRVTSSTLWAPGSNNGGGLGSTGDSQGLSNLNSSSSSYQPSSSDSFYTMTMGQDEIDTTPQQGYKSIYANSVEMVTTPQEYPIWKTKTPVITVVNGNDPLALHHRYRYLVVTPGADGDGLENVISSPRSVNNMMRKASNNDMSDAPMDNDGVVEARSEIMWEDPFQEEQIIGKEVMSDSNRLSYASLPSLKKIKQKKNLANLPFRTLSIPVAVMETLSEIDKSKDADEEMTDDKDEIPETQYTNEGVRIDVWNNSTDEGFQPYIERIQTKMESTQHSLSSETFHSATESQHENMDTSSNENTNITTQRKDRLFLVCFHLPVILKKDPQSQTWSATWNESLLSKSPNSILEKTHELHFVGHVTLSKSNGIESEHDQMLIRQALAPMGCTPLFLEEELMEAHYLGMCKQVLWPAFHNIDLLDLSTSGWGQREHLAPTTKFKSTTNPTSPTSTSSDSNTHQRSTNLMKHATNVRSTIESGWDQSILDKWWEAYTLVNQYFADKLSELQQPGDTTWVHDYHLALLPNMLDAKEQERFGRRTSKMVFFLHIPFPTSQIFRELECGEAVLQGMLHADVVGFHAFDHARHFLNAAKRILGLNYESLVGGLIGVQYRGKNVLVTMSNVSIEPGVVDEAMSLPVVVQGTTALQSRHVGRSIITGLDIAQRLSGITFKLLAFERLLTDYPVWKDKAVMVQRCLIPGSRRADETNTIREVRFLIRRIQEKFGRHVIDYQEVKGSSLPIVQRLALWRAADCMMLSPVREGLNMIPMEYVYARKAPLAAGVTIASEFSAVCSILNGALRVNPFDIQLTAANIDKALSMDVKEKESRRARDIDFVSNFPKEKWIRNVLRDLEEAARQGDEDDTNEEKKQENEAGEFLSTAAFLAREYDTAFSHVNNLEVAAAYKSTSRRVIILDFNGTIVIKEPPGKYLKREILGTSGLKPPSTVVKALKELVADPRNMVYIVSGDSQENLENAIGHVSGLGLAASNGACFSNPVPRGQIVRTWHSFDLGVDWEAVKRVSLPVLSKYTARTNGSYVKLTHSSIGWSYYSCDPQWGSLQASHLVLELEAELQAFDVRFVTLKGIVEIVPRRLNKGLIVKKVLQEFGATSSTGGLDFILCIGDDISDEKMFMSVFSYMAEIKKDSQASVSTHPNSFRTPSGMVEDESFSSANKKSSNSLYCYTATVGKKASYATQYVDDAKDVASLLTTITGGEFNARSLSFDESQQVGGSDYFA